MGGDGDALDRRAFAARKLLRFEARKHCREILGAFLVVRYSIFGSMLGGSETIPALSATDRSMIRMDVFSRRFVRMSGISVGTALYEDKRTAIRDETSTIVAGVAPQWTSEIAKARL